MSRSKNLIASFALILSLVVFVISAVSMLSSLDSASSFYTSTWFAIGSLVVAALTSFVRNEGGFFRAFLFPGICLAAVIVVSVFAGPKPEPQSETKDMSSQNETPVEIGDVATYSEIKAILDSPDVTLDVINKLNERISKCDPSDAKDLRNFVTVLKTFYIGEFLEQTHSEANLSRIIRLNKNDLSQEQKKIVEWYIKLSPQDRKKWEQCRPVKSFAQFKEEMERFLLSDLS